MTDSTTIIRWNQRELADHLATDLGVDDPKLGRWINGRIVGVLASESAGSTTDVAIGVSAIKAGTSTPEHSHVAEEVAIIISGRGTIHIDGESVSVSEGDVVFNPSMSVHRTEAAPDSPLMVLWVYSRSDSALRWLEENPVEG